jgi:hypothetical protein
MLVKASYCKVLSCGATFEKDKYMNNTAIKSNQSVKLVHRYLCEENKGHSSYIIKRSGRSNPNWYKSNYDF